VSNDARKKVLKKIDAKVKQIREIRKNSRSKKTAYDFLLNFFEEIEAVYLTATNVDEFYTMLSIAAYDLDNMMMLLDRGAKMEIKWQGGPRWDTLRIVGVEVHWSIYYQKLHDTDAVEYIDVARILLDEILCEAPEVPGKEET